MTPRCNFLRLSLIQVPLISASSTMLLKFNPNEVKAIHLRYTGGEVGAMSALTLDTVSKESCCCWHCQGNWWLEGSENYSETDHSEETDPDWGPSASVLIIGTLKEPPRDRKKRKNIKHSRSSVLMSLSTLLDRCDIDF